MQGLSVRNFKYMKAFAEAYPHFPNMQASLSQSIEKNSQKGVRGKARSIKEDNKWQSIIESGSGIERVPGN